jgi:hypothetical protein
MMHRVLAALAALLLTVSVAQPAAAQARKAAAPASKVPAAKHAQAAHDDDDEHEIDVPGGGMIAPGWTAKVDGNEPLSKVKFVSEGTGWHLRAAHSATFFRASDVESGSYTVKATLNLMETAPGHAEGYGLILGAKGLGEAPAKQSYTTFTIRADGKFQIRRRTNGEGGDVTNGAIASAAVHKADAKGRSSNEISVVVGATDVRFLVNGQEVHKAKRSEVDTDGQLAIRVNHNLDIAIPAFSVTKG